MCYRLSQTGLYGGQNSANKQISFCEITCAVSHAKHYNVVDMI